MGVNAAGVAGVATPQYLTCRGRAVLTTPDILTSVLFFFPPAQLLNTASPCFEPHLSALNVMLPTLLLSRSCRHTSRQSICAADARA